MSRRAPRPSPRGIVFAAIAGLVVVAVVFYFLTRDAQDTAETSKKKVDAVAGAAEPVIDCVTDPATTRTDECEKEAQDLQQTLEQQVPPVSLTKRQRAEVVLITSELIAARPEISADDVVDEVLDRLPDPEPGDRGPRGAAGEDGESVSAAEVRALVEAVIAANPPAPGRDGTDGTNGATGPKGDTGPRGFTGDTGPQGPAGPAGADGAPGQPGADGAPGPAGRGIASMSCDSETEMFVAHYTDGTIQPIEGSDCVAGGGLGLR